MKGVRAGNAIEIVIATASVNAETVVTERSMPAGAVNGIAKVARAAVEGRRDIGNNVVVKSARKAKVMITRVVMNTEIVPMDQ